jgi:hypothetical protein
MKKSLGQITYEARAKGIWGPWGEAPECIRDAYERDAKVTERAVLRRLRARSRAGARAKP